MLTANAEIVSDTQAADPIPIAHRGLLRRATENTLPAFAACLELGMGFELDIRTTQDGHLVVLHDDDVKRTTNGPSRSVLDMTLSELQQLDAGNWFDVAFAGEHIPTLDETLSHIARRKRGRRSGRADRLWSARQRAQFRSAQAVASALIRMCGVGRVYQ